MSAAFDDVLLTLHTGHTRGQIKYKSCDETQKQPDKLSSKNTNNRMPKKKQITNFSRMQF
jgi:hypothetical protein